MKPNRVVATPGKAAWFEPQTLEPGTVPIAGEVRAFFYGIFMEDIQLRRRLLRLWHSPYAPEPPLPPPIRLADLWMRFIAELMYEPVRFCMGPEYLLFYGNGSRSFRIAYAWLSAEQRAFLVWRVFAHRETLFKSIKVGANSEFFLEGFVYGEELISSHIWQREIMRDFAWLVNAAGNAFYNVELICALQGLWEHPRGKCDLFLLNLHDALQGRCKLAEVPCWGLAWYDQHPDERRKPATPKRVVLRK